MNDRLINRKKNSVLLVDDSAFNTDTLKKILEQDYIIYVASGGQEAVDKAIKYLPDVILLDIVMQGMDGFETIEILKNTVETRDIPVIFITGLDSSEDEEKGLSLNAADYISKPFSPAIVNLRVRNQVQLVNQIRTIRRLSLFDTLTDIPNRLSFNMRLDEEWKKAVKRQNSICLLIMDLDKFKLYNDKYGHVQGDILLQNVAKVSQRTVTRSSDFAARWGGEEFVVLLPNTDAKRAADIAESIRANIASMVVPCLDGTPTGATISIGVSIMMPCESSSKDTLITQADTALYDAKSTGSNCVRFFNSRT